MADTFTLFNIEHLPGTAGTREQLIVGEKDDVLLSSQWDEGSFQRFAKEARIAPVIGSTLFGILSAVKNGEPSYRNLHIDPHDIGNSKYPGFGPSDVHLLLAKSLSGDKWQHSILGELTTMCALSITSKYPLRKRYHGIQLPPHSKDETGQLLYDARHIGEQFKLAPPYEGLEMQEVLWATYRHAIGLHQYKKPGSHSINGLNFVTIQGATLSSEEKIYYYEHALPDPHANLFHVPKTVAIETFLDTSEVYRYDWHGRMMLQLLNRELKLLVSTQEDARP